jgi:CDP-4-dehydro-6-deoxyglucose reductase
MPQLLSLSRAARLAGVTRGEIQKKIRSGALETFEGAVRMTDLLRVYPNVRMKGDEALERVERIKAKAKPGKRVGDTSYLPVPEVLLERLHGLSTALTGSQARLHQLEKVLEGMQQRLGEIRVRAGAGLERELADLEKWLLEESEQISQEADGIARLVVKDTFLRIMAAHIKIIPSGHEFFAEGADTILDAALQAGMNLHYGCTSGNCGSCKARVVSGEVRKTRNHDYVLSEREKSLGYILMCSNTPVTDLVLEAPEVRHTGDLPYQQIRATAKAIRRLAPDLVELHIQTPRTQNLRFMAGQRATLTIDERLSASLPIASCPCDGRNLLFHVPRREGDEFSAAVFDRLQRNEMVTITGPEGDFVFRDDSTRDVLFIAGDCGFASIKSLVEHAIALDNAASFHLHWLDSGRHGHYLNSLCRSWRDALDNFSYQADTVDGTTALPSALERVLDGYADVAEYNVYVAGPAELTGTARARLGERLPPERLRLEVVEG